MLLTLVITLLLVWAAVIGSIYSNFLTFFSNFSETENYNKAYYASIAALERAELVVRQREPWYVWSGWRKSSINNNWKVVLTYSWKTPTSDGIIAANKFSYLSSGNSRWTNVFWSIDSRTTHVPKWQWNIDWMLISGDSTGYNMMDYETSETFLLYYDDSNGNPYKKSTIVNPTISQISWTIRLSPYLKNSFGSNKLDTTKSLTASWPKNDAIVDWQLMWTYTEGTQSGTFTIYSYQDIITDASNRNKREDKFDTAIRESDVNLDNGMTLSFDSSHRSPISSANSYRNRQKGKVTVISPLESKIKSWTQYYKTIFDNWSNLQLKLSLLNLLQSTQNSIIYPFLEYKLDFWTDISDKYFTINAEWKFDDYQVNTIIYRPTIKESVLWDFTVIF